MGRARKMTARPPTRTGDMRRDLDVSQFAIPATISTNKRTIKKMPGTNRSSLLPGRTFSIDNWSSNSGTTATNPSIKFATATRTISAARRNTNAAQDRFTTELGTAHRSGA